MWCKIHRLLWSMSSQLLHNKLPSTKQLTTHASAWSFTGQELGQETCLGCCQDAGQAGVSWGLVSSPTLKTVDAIRLLAAVGQRSLFSCWLFVCTVLSLWNQLQTLATWLSARTSPNKTLYFCRVQGKNLSLWGGWNTYSKASHLSHTHLQGDNCQINSESADLEPSKLPSPGCLNNHGNGIQSPVLCSPA